MTGSSRSLTVARVPGYLHHKATGQARVRINGHDFYLGPYGSVESRIEYGRLIAQHASGLPVRAAAVADDDSGLSVDELVIAFLKHAKKHYVKNGQPTSELDCINLATRPLLELYGLTSVDGFGPLSLKAVQTKMVKLKWVRRSINKAIGRIRHIFRWGVANEIVDPMTLKKLEAVAPLLAGRSEAKDNPKRSAVTEEQLSAVRDDVGELVRDLIDLQRFTGARSGELVVLTTADIDRNGDVWLATPGSHKTEHHGHSRIVAMGPKAQLIVAKYLKAKPGERLFPITRHAYSRAIKRSCTRLKIVAWVPHQLRHTRAGEVRSEFGLESCQAVLGHAKADMTEHYAKVSLSKAVEVARQIG